jgi:hypothetical protein
LTVELNTVQSSDFVISDKMAHDSLDLMYSKPSTWTSVSNQMYIFLEIFHPPLFLNITKKRKTYFPIPKEMLSEPAFVTNLSLSTKRKPSNVSKFGR